MRFCKHVCPWHMCSIFVAFADQSLDLQNSFTFSTGDRKDIDTFKRRSFFATKIKRISGSCIDILTGFIFIERCLHFRWLNIILKTITDCAHAFAINSYSGKLFWLEAFLFVCVARSRGKTSWKYVSFFACHMTSPVINQS